MTCNLVHRIRSAGRTLRPTRTAPASDYPDRDDRRTTNRSDVPLADRIRDAVDSV